jgi:hypothetical protein
MLKQDKRFNKIKNIYKRIARITGKVTRNAGSIHQVEEEESDNIISDPNEIAYQVEKNNLAHFAQAKDTPLRKVPYPYQEKEQNESNTKTSNPQSKHVLQILTGKSTDPI